MIWVGKTNIFFVENLALNDDRISTSWCIPGECVSIWLLIAGMLICLPFPFCADKKRNVQSIVNLNIKERTTKLLGNSKAVRPWKHLLSERVLKTTPFRRNDLSGSYVLLIRQFFVCVMKLDRLQKPT